LQSFLCKYIKHVAWINQRNITEEKLDKAINRLINSYNCFSLPKYWRSSKRVSIDGTKLDLYERNRISDINIRRTIQESTNKREAFN